MALLPRPLALAGALALGASAVGCSHEHGPLADKPDTTSLGTAGRWGTPFISTSEGLAWRPADPKAVAPGTLPAETPRLTTLAQPPITLFGTPANWGFGQTFGPTTGPTLISWTSGPNLPVEPWNMALEAPAGEGPAEGHGRAKAH